jgi:type IV pilus assembly protein PilE
MSTKNKKAFTLIEMLVVVLIIGILAAIALPQYQKAVERSLASEALSIMKTIKQAEEIYYLVHDEYTLDFDKLDVSISGTKVNNRTIEGKFFNYVLTDDGGDGVYLDAYRNNGGGYNYWFDCMFDKSSYKNNLFRGNLYCSARTPKDEEICESFGSYISAYGNDKRYKL